MLTGHYVIVCLRMLHQDLTPCILFESRLLGWTTMGKGRMGRPFDCIGEVKLTHAQLTFSGSTYDNMRSGQAQKLVELQLSANGYLEKNISFSWAWWLNLSPDSQFDSLNLNRSPCVIPTCAHFGAWNPREIWGPVMKRRANARTLSRLWEFQWGPHLQGRAVLLVGYQVPGWVRFAPCPSQPNQWISIWNSL